MYNATLYHLKLYHMFAMLRCVCTCVPMLIRCDQLSRFRCQKHITETHIHGRVRADCLGMCSDACRVFACVHACVWPVLFTLRFVVQAHAPPFCVVSLPII